MIYSHRPGVHFLPRGPDEAGGEDGWRVLSAGQVPDPAGTSELSEQNTWTHTQALTSCVTVVWPQIYCAEMQTEFPKEFVTLRSGQTDNYSEVYGNRCARRLRLRFRPDELVYSVCDRKLSLPIAGC